jgi:hypothetical protein
LAGSPLLPGDELEISGNVGRQAVLLIRAKAGDALTEATFSLPEHAAVTRAVITRGPVDAVKGAAVPDVYASGGKRLEPSSIRATKRD